MIDCGSARDGKMKIQLEGLKPRGGTQVYK